MFLLSLFPPSSPKALPRFSRRDYGRNVWTLVHVMPSLIRCQTDVPVQLQDRTAFGVTNQLPYGVGLQVSTSGFSSSSNLMRRVAAWYGGD
ncbi:hypothetical protein HYDPIDRAFT_105512 [Hydnomerulius pinastri MD-312]|nr:hypothetical protein HYDPIDRAFT_105512 [Hydnomerulius pinastri MD-312]